MHRSLALGGLALAFSVCGAPAFAAAPVIDTMNWPGQLKVDYVYPRRLQPVVVGYDFNCQISATGTPTSYDAQGLPQGLSVDHTTGLISGKPAVAGSFPVTLSATNADGSGTANVTLDVNAAPTAAPVIQRIPDRDTTLVAYGDDPRVAPGDYHDFILHPLDDSVNVPIVASGYPTSFSGTGLPKFDTTYMPAGGPDAAPVNGYIYGSIYYIAHELVPGRYNVTVNATNAVGTGSTSFVWTVHPAISREIEVMGAAYVPGDVITYHVYFNAPVYVRGIAYIPVHGGAARAYCTGGDGTNVLTFQYQVQASDGTFSDAVESILMEQGAITTADGITAKLQVSRWEHEIPSEYEVVDPATAVLTTGFTGPSAGTYHLGDTLTFHMTWAEPVLVDSSRIPYVQLTIGGQARLAPYVSGSGTNTLEFQYKVGAGDSGPVVVDRSLEGGPSVPNDAKAVEIQATPPDTSGVSVDSNTATMWAIEAPIERAYGLGDTLTFSANFTKPVTVTGSPAVAFMVGDQARKASYVSGSGTTTLTFSYVAAAGDNSYISIKPTLDLSNGSVLDHGTPAGTSVDPARVGSTTYVSIFTDPPKGMTFTVTPPAAPAQSALWMFGGTAPAGATVSLFFISGPSDALNGGFGSTTADANGNWSKTVTMSTRAGWFTWVAGATLNGAAVGTSYPRSFLVSDASTTPPPTPSKSDQTITFVSPVSAIIVGQPITLGAQSSAGLPITYTVVSGDATVAGNVLTPKGTADLVVRAASAGDDTHNAASVDVNFGSPQKAAQQISVTTTAGTVPAEKPVALNATSSSGLPVTYTVVSGPATVNGTTLTFTGTGTVVVKASQPGDGTYGAASDQTLTFTASPADRLVNLSSRLRVSGHDAAHASIAGFVVTGDAPKQVLVRAVGPSLAAFGVSAPLPDPELKLFDAKGAVVASNTGWSDDAKIAAAGDAIGAFKLTTGSKDAALLVTLEPGLYTAQVDSAHSGTALIEVYDATANAAVPTKQLINISTRGYVGTGDDVLVAGFVVAGDAPKRVLIRGVGPTLGSFGVSGTLADPMLTVYDAKQNVIGRDDNWGTPQVLDPTQTATSATDVEAADTASGAFALQPGSTDAAVILTLPPGQYSAIVTGAAGSTGAAMVEVYELPDGSK